MKHDKVAVNMLDVISNKESFQLKIPSIAADTEIAKTATRQAATIACTWTRAMFPTTILNISFLLFIFPKLA